MTERRGRRCKRGQGGWAGAGGWKGAAGAGGERLGGGKWSRQWWTGPTREPAAWHTDGHQRLSSPRPQSGLHHRREISANSSLEIYVDFGDFQTCLNQSCHGPIIESLYKFDPSWWCFCSLQSVRLECSKVSCRS